MNNLNITRTLIACFALVAVVTGAGCAHMVTGLKKDIGVFAIGGPKKQVSKGDVEVPGDWVPLRFSVRTPKIRSEARDEYLNTVLRVSITNLSEFPIRVHEYVPDKAERAQLAAKEPLGFIARELKETGMFPRELPPNGSIEVFQGTFTHLLQFEKLEPHK